ncbi:MAG: hypothetical protein HQK50_12500 [Oligoflexia bacterium]|nr:hypothetical protein [Oligoflexia bacterium]MBF0366386.1 hypothetical protein [Oligoflexia bacterium]
MGKKEKSLEDITLLGEDHEEEDVDLKIKNDHENEENGGIGEGDFEKGADVGELEVIQIEFTEEMITPKLESVLEILKIITPKDITKMSNFLGGSIKVPITQKLFEEYTHEQVIDSEGWKKCFDIFLKGHTAKNKTKRYDSEGLEIPLLADSTQIFSYNKTQETSTNSDMSLPKKVASVTVAVAATAVAPQSQKIVPQEKIDVDTTPIVVEEEKEIIDLTSTQKNNDKIAKDEDMPGVFGTGIINLLKIITPENIGKITKNVGEGSRVSLTEMIADRAQVADAGISKEKRSRQKALDPYKDKKLDKASKEMTDATDVIEAVTKSKPKTEQIQSQSEKVVAKARPGRARPVINRKRDDIDGNSDDDDNDNNGQERAAEQEISATEFYLQERAKMRDSESKILKNVFISSYQSVFHNKKVKKKITPKITEDEEDIEDDSSLEGNSKQEDQENSLQSGTLLNKKAA